MKYLFLAIYIFFIISCTSQVVLKKNKDNTNLVDEMNIDKFIIKLKAYSDRSSYPDIRN